jgi:hypothetical protein
MQTIQRLLPQGTVPSRAGEVPVRMSWSLPPRWGPDLFAVCATLVNLSGCYAHAGITGNPEAGPDDADFVVRVQLLGKIWRESDRKNIGELIRSVRHHWKIILRHGHTPIGDPFGTHLPEWCHSALELMAIADEACAGFGYPAEGGRATVDLREGFLHDLEQFSHDDLRRRSATLCRLVPPEECCVQPKGRTPQVGCTLRSLTHHVALLPPIGEVTTRWLVPPTPSKAGKFNMLLVPYPYSLKDDAVIGYGRRAKEGWGRFGLKQTWFPPGKFDESAEALGRFVDELVEEAQTQSGEPIHAVVLPELSLDYAHSHVIAQALQLRDDLKLFIGGVLARRGKGLPPQNRVMSVWFSDGAAEVPWHQAKHHRWKLERSQIGRYGLQLSPDEFEWWEDIDIGNRELSFVVHEESACMTVLICEDLARIDPVQPVLRAVGPNLVLALLMDGRQLPQRWSARYATVLADDPGSSVLTFTSAALIDRSPPDSPEPYEVGIWKDARGHTEIIGLPREHHAVFVSLQRRAVEERTLDRRSDGRTAIQYELARQLGVRHSSPPAWVATPQRSR